MRYGNSACNVVRCENVMTPTRHLQDTYNDTYKTPTKHLQDTYKTPTRHPQDTYKTPTRHLQ